MRRQNDSNLWSQLKYRFKFWQTAALPGFAVLSCVVIARVFGVLQPLEWAAFDIMLKQRPLEPPDSRLVIIGINERDIRAVGTYPIPDRTLAQLLRIIQQAQPRAIGLDIFRDVATGRNRTEIRQVFLQTPQLIGIKTALSNDPEALVAPPPELPPNQIGFVDTLFDDDGKLRRSLLAIKSDGKIEYAFGVRLAELYLQQEGIRLNYTAKPGESIRFGDTALPRFRANTGGYINAEARGNQVLINFRSHPEPFQVVSLSQILRQEVPVETLRDRIVLIGTTASYTNNDTFFTTATRGTIIANDIGTARANQAQLIYGIEHHAHVTSQILSTVLDGRSLLQSWSDGWEYVWITTLGCSGIVLGLLCQSPWKTLLGIGLGSLGIIGVSYIALLSGWWIPTIPGLFALWGTGLTTAWFDQRSRVLLEQREQMLKRTYDAVHNGPLQRLAAMLRNLDDETVTAVWLRSQLQTLNQELRTVYESMLQGIQGDEQFTKTPITELLYAAYEDTIQRDLPGFSTIKLLIPPDFSVLHVCDLTPEQKQGLYLFLQEALCNVGKHAINPQRLEVECKLTQNCYQIRVADDGITPAQNVTKLRKGRGTTQAEELARSLHGKFERRSQHPSGIICELSWPSRRKFFSLHLNRF